MQSFKICFGPEANRFSAEYQTEVYGDTLDSYCIANLLKCIATEKQIL